MSFSFYILLFFCTILFANEATAETKQESNPSSDYRCTTSLTSDELKDSTILSIVGVHCFKENEYFLALKYYRHAYEISKNPFLLGAIGRVFEELQYYTIAERYYRQFLQTSADKDNRISERLHNLNETMKKNGSSITIETNPSGAKVVLIINDGFEEPLGETPAKISLASGNYKFRFEKPNFQTRTGSISIPGDVKKPNDTIIYKLYSENTIQLSTTNQRWADISVATYLVSVPITVTGAVLLGIGYDKSSDARQMQIKERTESLKRATKIKTTGYAFLGIGVAGLITATVFQILSWDWSRDAPLPQDLPKNKRSKPMISSLTPTFSSNFIGFYGTF